MSNCVLNIAVIIIRWECFYKIGPSIIFTSSYFFLPGRNLVELASNIYLFYQFYFRSFCLLYSFNPLRAVSLTHFCILFILLGDEIKQMLD